MNQHVYIIYLSQKHSDSGVIVNDRYIKSEKILGIYNELPDAVYKFKKQLNKIDMSFYKSGTLYILDVVINTHIINIFSYPSKIVNKYVLYVHYWKEMGMGNRVQKNITVNRNTPKKYYNYLKNDSNNNNSKLKLKLKNKNVKINEDFTYYIVNSYIKLINNKHIDEHSDKYSQYIIIAVCDNLKEAKKIYKKYIFELAKNIPSGLLKNFDYFLRIDIINGGNFSKTHYASERYQERSINIKTGALTKLKLEIYKIFDNLENNRVLCNDVINIILEYQYGALI